MVSECTNTPRRPLEDARETREGIVAQVRDRFAGDENVEELASVFGWLWDLREENPAEFRAVLAGIYADADRRRAELGGQR
jgi:hypothetical protein